MWNDLSLNQKADLFKIYAANGYTSLDDIRNHYNSFADGGFTQKILNTAKNVARKAINSEARLADTYSSKKYTFEEAYKDARSKGQRTFFWNGNYYNTDYESSHGKQYKADLASGKAQAFEAKYPNFTNPELRKEKQEELDTYGITNEQTKNKTIVHSRLLDNIVPGGYIKPVQQLLRAVVLNKSGLNNKDFVSLPDGTNTPIDQFRMWLGYPQITVKNGETPTFSISAYRPQNAEFPYYLHQVVDSPVGSEYKTNNLQYLHDKLKEVGDRYRQSNSDKDADEFQKLYNAIYGDKNSYTVGRFQINKDGTIIDSYNEENIENGNNVVSGEWLGDYTIGKSPNFISYYDKWDINPFSTNAPRYGGKTNKFLNNLIEKGPLNTKIGTPLNLYNRAYIEEEPNIDSLYFNFADGGYLDNLTYKPFSYSPIPLVRYDNGGEKGTPRKVDFREFAKIASNNDGRYVPIEELEQFQDSLITRGYGEPQRLAILATSAQEMGRDGAASRGIGGNGYLGLSSGRMPISLLDNTVEGRGKQITYVLDDLENVYTGTHPQAGNWNDGGSGGPRIMSGKDGSTQFWNATDANLATQILNKSYIRPANALAEWQRRAKVAENMAKYLK